MHIRVLLLTIALNLCPTLALSDPDSSWVRWRSFLGAVKVTDGTNGATDESAGTAIDGNGNVYVVGFTEPPGYPWNLGLAPLSPLHDGRDAFVVKLRSTTGEIVWYTFLGGAAIDRARGVAVDGSGNVYVTGYSENDWGAAMPPVAPPTPGQGNGFVAKLSQSGQLLWRTFHGSDGRGVAVDDSGDVYLAGRDGEGSLFVKLRSSDGAELSKRPDPNHRGAKGIAVGHEAAPSVYIVGDDGSNAFAATLSPTDDYASWSVVDPLLNVANAVAVGIDGSVYVAGAIHVFAGGQVNDDARVVKLGTTSGKSLGNSTGENDELAISIAVDQSGDLFVVGNSWADSGPPYPGWGDPQVPFQGKQDAWLARLSGTDMALIWNTFLGSSAGDWASGVAVDPDGIYVSGLGQGAWEDFWPAAAPPYWQATDAFIVAVHPSSPCAPAGDPEEQACSVKRSRAWGAYLACVESGTRKYYADPGLHGDPYTKALKKCRVKYDSAWGPPCTGPRFSNNADGTVTDHLSGLVWEKKQNRDDLQNLADPHDADNVYTWSDGIPWFETGTAFDTFLRTLNDDNGFACANGWRLPTLAELHTLLDVDGTGMHPDFPDAANNAFDQYWSSTSSPLIFGGCHEIRACAWSVIFNPNLDSNPQTGGVTVNGKGGGHVRAVRGGL